MYITITQLQASVHLGVSDEEQSHPQVVTFDIVFTLKDDKSLKSDRVEDTLNYMNVIGLVNEICSTQRFRLMERLVHVIGKAVLELSDKIQEVEITSTKRISPLTESISFTALFKCS